MGKKKAVLVGCNYPGTKAELKGCINDVRRMRRCLVERYGFAEEDITVLIDTDGSYTQPTDANIRRAINQLVSHARPGDFLFLHYSGHGTRLPAETGEDDDTGYDECIVPCDMNLITEDLERARAVAQLVKAAEAAAQRKAAELMKLQREREREAARLALQKMEKTVDIDENKEIWKDLKILGIFESWSTGHGNPLEQLGLFLKKDDLDDEDAEVWLSAPPSNGDVEEGEIVLST